MSRPVNNEDAYSLTELQCVFRNAPATRSAQENIGVLIRASREAGYSAIGVRCGRDKSWVSRFLSGGEAKADIGELLHWLDVCDLRITHGNESEKRLAEAAETIYSYLNEIISSGKVSDPVHSALLSVAQYGIQAMRSRE